MCIRKIHTNVYITWMLKLADFYVHECVAQMFFFETIPIWASVWCVFVLFQFPFQRNILRVFYILQMNYKLLVPQKLDMPNVCNHIHKSLHEKYNLIQVKWTFKQNQFGNYLKHERHKWNTWCTWIKKNYKLIVVRTKNVRRVQTAATVIKQLLAGYILFSISPSVFPLRPKFSIGRCFDQTKFIFRIPSRMWKQTNGWPWTLR